MVPAVGNSTAITASTANKSQASLTLPLFSTRCHAKLYLDYLTEFSSPPPQEVGDIITLFYARENRFREGDTPPKKGSWGLNLGSLTPESSHFPLRIMT